jgi:hypothetical protein
MLNGWGGYILTQAHYLNAFFSHDEYIDFFAAEGGLGVSKIYATSSARSNISQRCVTPGARETDLIRSDDPRRGIDARLATSHTFAFRRLVGRVVGTQEHARHKALNLKWRECTAGPIAQQFL